ncbi:MAG: hypothetical protein N4A57_02885 [Anaeromicrobium sp.]|jgi:benzoyl-CoA reductase/2-hydroxyglutaryl-CoA dehydratase subunit BcrC/BadD/HgdB|uniref:hypothetical protein n=1 Tax=Anaeromicrobium sp. TaxID=1929132 RepID=UPI0025DBD76B|nr:hypothetical protein [Anaeromicrobium sp.]MCT4593207.1 hypothetical protein [Anaeromicrobium sp.]
MVQKLILQEIAKILEDEKETNEYITSYHITGQQLENMTNKLNALHNHKIELYKQLQEVKYNNIF